MSTMRVTNLKHENSASNNIVLNSDGSVGGDLATTLASKVDYALPTNAQTGTTYTFVAADAEKLTTASNASPVTLTIPPASSVAWPDNTVLRVVNYGAGAVTIDGGSGVTVTNTSSTIAQYGAAVAIRTGSDAWTVVPFGGGDVPPATVSSPAATGQYTDTGVTYDYYTFTASGTLTVDTAGFADVLVVGGGGGGGRLQAGGGGAGGYLDANDVYLSAGTLQVRVGAGGAGGNAPTGNRPTGTSGNASGIGDYIVSVGGGGGGGNEKAGFSGGSGGGGGYISSGGAGFGAQGNDGGAGSGSGIYRGGGGGGASAAGVTGGPSSTGDGGAGASNSITGSAVTRAGGGGGGGRSGGAGTGGAGGGGNGSSNNTTGGSGSANTGGGGGGGGFSSGDGGAGGAGGSGIVIVRVKV